EEIAKRDDRARAHAVGPVLLRAVVPEADLVLVVEPGLVVLGPRGVDDPSPETPPHPREVVADRLAVGAGERRQQVRRRAHEAIPDVEDALDARLDDRQRLAQRVDVVLAEERARLHALE